MGEKFESLKKAVRIILILAGIIAVIAAIVYAVRRFLLVTDRCGENADEEDWEEEMDPDIAGEFEDNAQG